MLEKKLERVGLVGRFKPLHNGSAKMLDCICANVDHVVIGIGSCNKYNLRNFLTPDETKEMINTYLSPRFSNYEFVFIPDYGHIPEYSDGQRWVQEIKEQYNNLDAFVTANDYTVELLKPHYKIIHSSEFIPKEKWEWIKGTVVRMEMAKGGNNWKQYVPNVVAEFLEKNHLVESFRKEFGLQTLSTLIGTDYMSHENFMQEKLHTTEV